MFVLENKEISSGLGFYLHNIKIEIRSFEWLKSTPEFILE